MWLPSCSTPQRTTCKACLKDRSERIRKKGENVNPLATLLQNFDAALYTVKRFYQLLGAG